MRSITGLTVNVAVSDLPPALAVMVTSLGLDPALCPVARPDELTFATDVLSLDHVKVTF